MTESSAEIPQTNLPQKGDTHKKSDTHTGHQSFWLWVMCLTGVDYFSTLAYQPSTAFKNAGLLAPFATVVLVLVTLFGALPVYSYVARKSFTGQGSIGMLARQISGWPGKIVVLVLLGFAATDFVITKTLSAADATEHLIHNPNWPFHFEDHDTEVRQKLIVTFTLLVLLGAVFMKGFKEVIGLAVILVAIYLSLNLVIVGAGLNHLWKHPELWDNWLAQVRGGNWYLDKPVTSTSWWSVALVSLVLFPKLALGLSGFETGVAVMPLVRGSGTDTAKEPLGRIRNTRRLLICAALIMSVFLLSSSIVVTTLIEPNKLVALDKDNNRITEEEAEAIGNKPKADGRALAYLAHAENGYKLMPFFGATFGTIYDFVTVLILWFAGASAMAGLLNLVPQYLPRYGMAPEWARAIRPLVLLFTGINLLVTFIFEADVDAQSDAYATGVLVLISSACVATLVDKYRSREGTFWQRLSIPYAIITVVFFYTTIDLIIHKAVGLKIASWFIVTILITSFASRIARSRELRFSGFEIKDGESKLYWDSVKHLELSVLVPHRPGRRSLASKERAIRQEHRIPRDITIIFVEVELQDASDFEHRPVLEVRLEDGRYVMKITQAASIAHTLAALALEMAKFGKPPEIHFGWTEESPLSGTIGFLLFGEGNVPWMVRDLIIRAEADPEKRPLIIIAGS